MILIPPLRTRRLSVKLKEVSIGDAIRLAGIHPSQNEYAITAFLEAVIDSATAPTDKHVTDPRLWTVQERTLAVCHYLAAASDNGEANFPVGEHGRLTDYMDTGRDFVEWADAGEAAQDRWRMVPMTGMAAEVIERLDGGGPGVPAGRMHWLIGSMAAQLVRVDAAGQPIDAPAPADDSGLSDWIKARMGVFAAFPQSDFMALLGVRATGLEKLVHLFRVEAADDGLVCLPVRERGEGGELLPPARFPVGQCLSPVAHELAQPVPKPSGEPGAAHGGHAAAG